MCRIFAFRSIVKSSVHSSLVGAENALGNQSQSHPDGWGVAFYHNQIPHVIKSEKSAFDNHIFKKVSGVVSSQTVLAHIRKATKGKINVLNTHPFQFSKWTFIHNGNIKNFSNIKEQLKSLILPEFIPYILGDTDSEIIFFILLSFQKSNLHSDTELAIKKIIESIGPLSFNSDGNQDNYLTFVLTDGESMISFQGGKELFFSTYKSQCPEKDLCSEYTQICESKAKFGDKVNHLLFSSTPIDFYLKNNSYNNIWQKMNNNQLISITSKFKLKSSTIV